VVRREPLLLPFAALGTGILVAHFVYFRLADVLVPGLCTGVLAAATVLIASARRMRLTAACTLLLVAGIATQVVHRQGRAPRLNAEDNETVLLSGCITNPPVFSPNREQFTVELAPHAAARISVNLKAGTKLALAYGQRAEVAAKIRSPRNYENPGEFDLVTYLANQHIYWSGSVSGLSGVRVLPGRCGSLLLTSLYALRTRALAQLADLYPDDLQTRGLLQATLIGQTAGVERRWTSDFRVTSTYHAIVISGLHISVLAISLLWIFRLLRFRRAPALLAAAVACWVYAFISGFNSPAVRASAGFTLFMAASYCFRKPRTLNLLAAIGIVYLILDPDQLFDPSFQLSFLSCAIIGSLAIPVMNRFTHPLRGSVKRLDQVGYDPQVEPRAAQWRVELRLIAETLRSWTGLSQAVARFIVARAVFLSAFVAEVVIISACVQFGLALPMVSYFHRLSITGLSANLFVVPLLCVVVPLGFASILTGWHVLALATKLFLYWAESTATWHAHFEPAWRMAALPVWIAIAFAVSLVCLAITIRRSPRWIAPALACALVLFTLICWQPWKPEIRPGMLELTAIDVSQGDSLLLVFPDGETMLIDAGGFPGMGRMLRKPQLDVGEDVVSPYLWSRRIRRLDYAVLTHGHSDHMGGLASVLDNFRPRALWIGAEPETAEWRSVRQHAAMDNVRIVALNRTCQPITIGGTRVRVLAPSPDYVAAELPTNDDSLVLEVTYKKRSVLLTGDAERPIENEMLADGELHAVTLLKVGHHGSKTSSSEQFLSQVTPQFAFISDGYMNQFHHPSPEVLQRLAQHHVIVFRTDQRGLITFRTDGDKVELEPFH
jgi:competence protein ComEC